MDTSSVKISYVKTCNKEGVIYKTRVKMSKDTFKIFYKHLKTLMIKNNGKERPDNSNIEKYVKDDIKRFNELDDTMYLRLYTTRLLQKFLDSNNLNPSNRALIGNAYIKIV